MVYITKLRVRKTVDEIEGLSPQTRAFLYEYDPIIVQALKTLPDYVIESNSNEESNNHKALKTAEVDLGWKRIGSGFKDWKRSKAKLYTRKVSKNFTCVMVNEDDFFGKQTSLFYTLQNIATGSKLLFPLVDTFQFPPVEVYPKIMEELRFVPGKASPIPTTPEMGLTYNPMIVSPNYSSMVSRHLFWLLKSMRRNPLMVHLKWICLCITSKLGRVSDLMVQGFILTNISTSLLSTIMQMQSF